MLLILRTLISFRETKEPGVNKCNPPTTTTLAPFPWLQLLDSLSSSLPAGDALRCTDTAAHWAAKGLHTMAQLPCAAAAHVADLPCDLQALLASVGPAGEHLRAAGRVTLSCMAPAVTIK